MTGHPHLHRTLAVLRRVVVGCYQDGFIHAGNLAYMSVLAIFPFCITGAAIFSALGEEAERTATIKAVLAAVPPVVAEVIGPVAQSVVEQRSGWLLWVGALIGLWTVGSLVETIRDILHRAYHARPSGAFWKYRVLSTLMILAAMLVLVASLFVQVLIGTAQEFVAAWLPQLRAALGDLAWPRIITTLVLLGCLQLLFMALTPRAYRGRAFPKWPGALLVTLWWFAVTLALPPLVSRLFAWDLTYGSLAGMMIALFFFWLVGLGMVAGAELNAALALTPHAGTGGNNTEQGE